MEAIRPYEPLLQKSALFAGLSPAETEEALRRMQAQIREYPRGAFLHHAGQPMEQFGLVLSGGVNVCKDDLEGNRMLMAKQSVGGAADSYDMDIEPTDIEVSDTVTVVWEIG